MAKKWLKCPKCAASWQWGYWQWVFKCAFHMFGYRWTKCPYCDKKSWIRREK